MDTCRTTLATRVSLYLLIFRSWIAMSGWNEMYGLCVWICMEAFTFTGTIHLA